MEKKNKNLQLQSKEDKLISIVANHVLGKACLKIREQKKRCLDYQKTVIFVDPQSLIDCSFQLKYFADEDFNETNA